jgi:hypothetical protein
MHDACNYSVTYARMVRLSGLAMASSRRIPHVVALLTDRSPLSHFSEQERTWVLM